MSAKSGLETLLSLHSFMVKTKTFDRLIDKVKIIAGGNGSLTAVLKIEKEHCNRGEFLHGAMAALLIDDMSGLALMTYPKIKTTGVSLVMNIQYLKAAPLGQEILIKSTTDKVGSRIAFLNVEIFNKGTGELVAKGTHTKFIG